ncbi:E3 ubiquitin-protein ligase ATL9-like [Syzygium oleosum]|uniref:E3 ubiquitin-protein ligase ATL9-like n=1 Tax=Syzygium oleosum TaxID=219896 RepID=UPI0024BB1E68|nr:E3 ubiquitin-protein ligase ATL9-like [Syzygium oleosum]
MPPVAHPPSTWRRSAATQPASASPSYGCFSSSAPAFGIFSLLVVFVVPMVALAVLVFFSLLLVAYLVVGFFLLPTHPHAAALQLAAAAWSDDESSSSATQGYASVLTRIALAFYGVIFSLFYCLYLFAVIDPPVLLDPDVTLRRLGAPRGLDPAVIETFPTVVYSAVKGHKIGEASLECAVCLTDFGDDDMLRLIPKWLASHTTCPVCRADLASRPAGDLASQLVKSGTEPPRFEVKVEAASPDGGAAERSRQEGRPERIQPPDPWDKNESGSFSNPNRTGGSGRIRRFPRSHSTWHSLVRPGEDMECFTLRLPAEVRKQLMDRPGPVLPLEGCSRRGYRCEGEGSSLGRHSRRPDRLDWAAKLERWDFNSTSPRVAADGGGGPSQGGSGRIRRFPRSHSTGHSLGRPSKDTERFTLRLPTKVWKQLMDWPVLVLPLEGCSR